MHTERFTKKIAEDVFNKQLHTAPIYPVGKLKQTFSAQQKISNVDTKARVVSLQVKT